MDEATYQRVLENCKGKPLRCGDFGSIAGAKSDGLYKGVGALCPLGHYIVGTPSSYDYVEDIAKLLNCSQRQVWEFIDGFDGNEGPGHPTSYYLSGQRMRAELGL